MSSKQAGESCTCGEQPAFALVASLSLLTSIAGPDRACGMPPASSAADCIQARVEQVSETSLRTHVQSLEFPRATEESRAMASAYIAEALTSFGYEVTCDPVETSENVIARLEGVRTPERVFVVGAHFDTVPGSPGADDNASGIAGMLEIARVLADSRPASSVEFVAFALEELGLIGSRQYAQRARANGVDIIGMISLEMIGYTCDVSGCQVPFSDVPDCLDVEPEGVDVGTFIAVVANDASSGLLEGFEQAARDHVTKLELVTARVAGVGLCFPDTRRSDHSPFWDQGYRAVMSTDTANFRNPNYHQPTDTSDTLDFVFATRVTQAALAFVLLEVDCRGGCPADVDLSGAVDFADLLAVLSAWGPYEPCPPFIPEDVDDDCEVGFDDLLIALAAWGPCG